MLPIFTNLHSLQLIITPLKLIILPPHGPIYSVNTHLKYPS